MTPSLSRAAVVGGDARQGYLANLLACGGFETFVCGLERCGNLCPAVRAADPARAVRDAQLVVLPLPVSRDGTTVNAPLSAAPIPLFDLLDRLRPEQLAVGGMIGPELTRAAQGRGLRLVDYFAREELSVLNAIPTAEGALEIALRETNTTVFGTACLVVGYGRIGKLLARLLQAMGARVAASARRWEDLAWIRAAGLEGVRSDGLREAAGRFDLIFNTVPAVLFDDAVLSRLKENALLIDLASAPGGVDAEAAARYGRRVILAQSLPGRVAPVFAAEVLRDTIINVIREEFS